MSESAGRRAGGELKPGQGSKKREGGRREEAKKSRVAGGSSKAGAGQQSVLLRFLLMPVPFSLFLLVEGKCF